MVPVSPGPASGTVTIALVEQAQGHGDAAQVEEQEWEIVKILDKRETLLGVEYMVRWKNTWLPKDELGNLQELLQEFKIKGRAWHGCKPHRPARRDNV